MGSVICKKLLSNKGRFLMITFLVGLVILFVGGALYGRFVEKVFAPDDRPTPAMAQRDGLDYIPMPKWKNMLIELLNIAGTGPILGPIQGILFGPLAFLLIPIGNVFGGAVHDYFSGMLSVRNRGDQMPALIRRFMGNGIYHIYNVFACLLMFLVGVVFLYLPGDLIAGLLKQPTTLADGASITTLIPLFVIYGCILIYYLLASITPIDKIIGRVYPIFGAVLLISAVGIAGALVFKGYLFDTTVFPDYLRGVTTSEGAPFGVLVPEGALTPSHLIPIFFITVACGITSGFHASQATLIARSVSDERQGRQTFYNMMILEGLIAMIWAAGAMVIYNMGADAGATKNATLMVSVISIDFLGKVGGVLAILGVIVLPITSGDTALRSLRMMIGDYFNIDQRKRSNVLTMAGVIFALVLLVLIFAKVNPNGFNILWRYFGFANEALAVFAFAMATIYLAGRHAKPYWIMTLIPGSFYMFVVSSYLLNAKIGFNRSWEVAYIGAAILVVVYIALVVKAGFKRRAGIDAGTVEDTDIRKDA